MWHHYTGIVQAEELSYITSLYFNRAIHLAVIDYFYKKSKPITLWKYEDDRRLMTYWNQSKKKYISLSELEIEIIVEIDSNLFCLCKKISVVMSEHPTKLTEITLLKLVTVYPLHNRYLPTLGKSLLQAVPTPIFRPSSLQRILHGWLSFAMPVMPFQYSIKNKCFSTRNKRRNGLRGI